MQFNLSSIVCFIALFVTLYEANAQNAASHPDPKEKIENIIELRPMKPQPAPVPSPGANIVSFKLHQPTNPTAQSSSESFQCHNFAYKFTRDLQAKSLKVEVTTTAKNAVKFNHVDTFDLSESDLNQLLSSRRAFLQTIYKCHDNRLGIHLLGFEWQAENQQTEEVSYHTTLFFDGKINKLSRTILD
jgi:hypothetical protein